MSTEPESEAVGAALTELPPGIQAPSPIQTVTVYEAYDLYLHNLASLDGMPERPTYD